MLLRNLQLVMRALALGMIILVAVPASGIGDLLYFCTMTGEVGSKCCCQHEAPQDIVAEPSLTAAPCCKVVSAEELIPPVRVEVVPPQFEPPLLVVVSFLPDHFPTAVRAPTQLNLPDGSCGPPLFVKHCSYLI